MCLMFILALDHSSLFPVVMNLRVGINVLKNYLRPTVTFLQSGLCSSARHLETPPSSDRVKPHSQAETGESGVTASRGEGLF